jgi:hypothetical protein
MGLLGKVLMVEGLPPLILRMMELAVAERRKSVVMEMEMDLEEMEVMAFLQI